MPAPPRLTRQRDGRHLQTIFAQVFAGGVLVGDDAVRLVARHDTRAHSHWAIFRNASTYQGEQSYVGFGATWQLAFPGDGSDADPAETSLA